MPGQTPRQRVLMFVESALDDGWTVRKNQSSYVFSKPHEGKKQVFTNEYLVAFVEKHLSTAADGGQFAY